MAADGANLQESWLSFVQSHRGDEIENIVEEYPNERSLHVDVLDLHQQAPQFAKALFSDPDRVLTRASAALAGSHDAIDRINIRLDNHPGLLPLSNIRARHIGELVTLEGFVESVGPVNARAARAAFVCRSCDAKIRTQTVGLELRPPDACRDCGSRGTFEFRPDKSTYEDYQRISLREPSESFVDDNDDLRRIDVYLDDDMVGTVESSAKVLATGIIRLQRPNNTNEFVHYLDANTVSDEPGNFPDEGEADGLQDVIESRWKRELDDPD